MVDRIAPRWKWVIAAILCVGVGFFFCWWPCWRPAGTLLIVRHADRSAGQDALSAAGVTRAQELAHVTAKVTLAAVYQTDTQRSRQTAAPVSTAHALTPVELPANYVGALMSDINTNHRSATVLIVAHSNTVPQIIAAAGGPSIPNIVEDEFDNFFVLHRCHCLWSAARLLNLQYGAPSP